MGEVQDTRVDRGLTEPIIFADWLHRPIRLRHDAFVRYPIEEFTYEARAIQPRHDALPVQIFLAEFAHVMII